MIQSKTEMSTKTLPVSRGWQEHRAGDIRAIREPTSRKYGSLDVAEDYGPPRLVARAALISFLHA
jgi:hypothetical protein